MLSLLIAGALLGADHPYCIGVENNIERWYIQHHGAIPGGIDEMCFDPKTYGDIRLENMCLQYEDTCAALQHEVVP